LRPTWDMSRLIKESELIKIVIGTVGLIQQFWNDLDTIQILEAGTPAPGDFTSFLPGGDVNAEKWEILNDWMQTIGPWEGLRTAHFRKNPKFNAAHPTPAVWIDQFLRQASDPFDIFLPQTEEGRVVVGKFNNKPVRKRL